MIIVDYFFWDSAGVTACFLISSATTPKPRPCSPTRAGFDGGIKAQEIGLAGLAFIKPLVLGRYP
jgi:hypothetical protein